MDGVVRFAEEKKNRVVLVTSETEADEKKYVIPYDYRICVAEGQKVKAGDSLTEGASCPGDILAIKGPEAVQDYIISQIQLTYGLQGVDINDKHIEVIVRQMMRKVRITDPGDTGIISTLAERYEVYAANEEIRARVAAGETELREAEYEPVLLGITKASLATESFLSAASFQETTRVLTDAAIKGKVDPLFGLKENVIIGKLVPAGTGTKYHTQQEPTEPQEVEEASQAVAEEATEQTA